MAGLTLTNDQKKICDAAVRAILEAQAPKGSKTPKASPKGSKTPKASPSGASPDKKRKRDADDDDDEVRTYSCGNCHEVGHNRATCPHPVVDKKKAKKAAKKKAKKAAKKVKVIDVSSDNEATDDESSDSDSDSESDSASGSSDSDDSDSDSSDDEDDEPKKKKAKAGANRCGACQKKGHNRQTCPMVKFWDAREAKKCKKGKC